VSAPYFSPDDSFVVFGATPAEGASVNSVIYLLDLSSGRLKSLSDGLHIDYEPAFSPDGNRIIFVSDSGYKPHEAGGYEVWTMDLHGKGATRLTFLSKNITDPYYMPDGKSILFEVDLGDDNGGELWRMDNDGQNIHRLAGRKLYAP
jgi:TolB protein